MGSKLASLSDAPLRPSTTCVPGSDMAIINRALGPGPDQVDRR